MKINLLCRTVLPALALAALSSPVIAQIDPGIAAAQAASDAAMQANAQANAMAALAAQTAMAGQQAAADAQAAAATFQDRKSVV